MTQGSKAGELVPIGVEALALQAADELETTRTLARYGYHDTTLDQLLMQVRQRVQRSTEDMLEIGRAVCCLRELPRGRYGAAIASIGLSADTARRLAGVAMKFLGNDTFKPLLDLDQSKIYELALLDDADLEEIVDDPARLDAVERMSVSDLRKALREAKHHLDAKDHVIKTVQEDNTHLREKAIAQNRFTLDKARLEANKLQEARLRELQDAAVGVIAQFNSFGAVLAACSEQGGESEWTLAADTAAWLAQQISTLYVHHAIDVDFSEVITPSWTRQPLATAGEG